MKIYVNNKEMEVSDSITGIELAKELQLTAPDTALAMTINGKKVDLAEKLKANDRVVFISFEEKEGKEIFWHTSAHVLAQAICRLWPDAQPTIGPPIENGFYYDFANLNISDKDFGKIEKEMKKIISENYKPERCVFSNKSEAKKAFGNNPYKMELIDTAQGDEISTYKQGEFADLCRGPHLPQLGKIKAIKILKTAGAYWRGDSTKEMLTRIYAISFPDKKMLADYLHFLEEAKKRDHKVIGRKLDLFSFHEEAPGMPFYHPNGMVLWEGLTTYIRECLSKDYEEIKTPILLNKELWIRSGHWLHYKENMYTTEIENRAAAVKPMNCPGGMLYYKTRTHSYREFPLRVAEIGNVHRHEKSGSINGLFRVRSFHQDDAHIFMMPHQIKDEIIKILQMADMIYSTFGLSYRLELSTRPEKSKTIGTDEEWEYATNGLKDALDAWGHPYKINEGDGAFYGPKIDLHIGDALGRFWQCGTVQVDRALPENFDLEYMDPSGEHKRPVMIHRALFGSIERFLAVMIEHFAGKFPLWISPIGVRLIPVADRHAEYANKIKEEIKKHHITCDIDATQESVGKKIRNAQLMQVNYMLTVGDQEEKNQTISLRTRDNIVHGELTLTQFLDKIVKEKVERSLRSPFEKQ